MYLLFPHNLGVWQVPNIAWPVKLFHLEMFYVNNGIIQRIIAIKNILLACLKGQKTLSIRSRVNACWTFAIIQSANSTHFHLHAQSIQFLKIVNKSSPFAGSSHIVLFTLHPFKLKAKNIFVVPMTFLLFTLIGSFANFSSSRSTSCISHIVPVISCRIWLLDIPTTIRK